MVTRGARAAKRAARDAEAVATQRGEGEGGGEGGSGEGGGGDGLPLTAPDFLDALLFDSGGSWRLSCRLSTASKACCVAIRQHRVTLRSLNFERICYDMPDIDASAVRVICRDCPGLRELLLACSCWLGDVERVDELVSMLVHAYPKLRQLHMHGADCGATSIELIRTLPELESLVFGRLVGFDPRPGLSGLWPELRSLRFDGLENFPGKGVRRYAITGLDCPKLETFDYDANDDRDSAGCCGLTSHDLPRLFVRPPPLRKLAFGDTCSFSTSALTSFLHAFPDLRELRITSNGSSSSIENDALAALVACPKLEDLDLAFCEIDDEGMALLADLRCPLKKLGLTGLKMTSVGIRHLADSHLAATLEHVDMNECEELFDDEDEALHLLLDKCKNILTLELSGTAGLSSGAVEDACKELRRRNPKFVRNGEEQWMGRGEPDEETMYRLLLGITPPATWPAAQEYDDDDEGEGESEGEGEGEDEGDDEDEDEDDDDGGFEPW